MKALKGADLHRSAPFFLPQEPKFIVITNWEKYSPIGTDTLACMSGTECDSLISGKE
jgi:hypothetical protein